MLKNAYKIEVKVFSVFKDMNIIIFPSLQFENNQNSFLVEETVFCCSELSDKLMK